MDFKTLKIRKSEVSLGNLVLTMVLIIACFMGMFYYWNFNMGDSGKVMSSEYTNMTNDLNSSQEDLSNNLKGIRNNISTVFEPEAGIFAVAINGMKGVGNILKAPLFLMNVADAIFKIFYDSLTFLPPWVRISAIVGLLGLIIFLILAVIAGGVNKISK